MIALLSLFIIHSSPFNEVAVGPSKSPKEFSLEGGETVLVQDITFQGNKAVSTANLMRIANPFLNKMISESDVKELEERIELLYRTRGFPEAKVLVTEKGDGMLNVLVTEGQRSK